MEVESRIQATVEQYFAESLIAPSPWIEGGRRRRSSSIRPPPQSFNNPHQVPVHRSSSLPNTPSAVSMRSFQLTTDRFSNTNDIQRTTVDAIAQTDVSFPPDFDFLSLIGTCLIQCH